MRKATVHCLLISTVGVCACFTGCEISDEKRCGDGEVYVFSEREGAWSCLPAPNDSETSADTDRATEDRPDSTDEPPTGQGQPCENHEDCSGFEADYCVLNPMTPEDSGACVVKGCTTSPDSCRGGYRCCDFPPIADGLYDGNNLCLPAEARRDIVDQLGSCDG